MTNYQQIKAQLEPTDPALAEVWHWKERAEKAIAERDAARAACAEMRCVIEGVIATCIHPDIARRAVFVDLAPLRKVLSTSHGQGFISSERVRGLVEALETIQVETQEPRTEAMAAQALTAYKGQA